MVCAPSKDEAYPERPGYKEQTPSWCRVPAPLEQMLQAMEEKCNAHLRKDGHSEMIVEELVRPNPNPNPNPGPMYYN